MAQRAIRHLIRIPAGYRSREAASFIAQLDDQTRRTFEELRGASRAELAWQPGVAKRPDAGTGHNTIGMLLAHNAIVETWWLAIASEQTDRLDMKALLGIGNDDDGMPQRPDGTPPRALVGWTLDRYAQLLVKSRTYVKRAAKRFTEADMDRVVSRTRRDGVRAHANIRWILYHVLEHYAGHYGQMLLLHHQYRDRKRRAR